MERRDLLKGAGLLAATATIGAQPAGAVDTDACGRVAEPKTFILVHGASVGAWTLTPVAELLRRAGHRVFVPALTGLGERSHLLSREVNLTTHVNDIAGIFRFENLSNVVLVGHSYGGLPVTCVADRLADKIASLVFLDCLIGEDGKTGDEITGKTGGYQERWDEGEAGAAVPEGAPPFMTPQPLGTFLETMHLSGAWLTVPHKTYVRFGRSPQPPLLAAYERFKGDPAWTTKLVDAEHIYPVTNPEDTAEIIEASI